MTSSSQVQEMMDWGWSKREAQQVLDEAALYEVRVARAREEAKRMILSWPDPHGWSFEVVQGERRRWAYGHMEWTLDNTLQMMSLDELESIQPMRMDPDNPEGEGFVESVKRRYHDER